MVAGLRFSLSTAYTLGDMGRRSEGDAGSVESLRLEETRQQVTIARLGNNRQGHVVCPEPISKASSVCDTELPDSSFPIMELLENIQHIKGQLYNSKS